MFVKNSFIVYVFSWKIEYLSVVPCPNLSFLVSSLSQVLNNPSHDHWFLAEKGLRYLKGTFDLGLVFKHSECLKLVGFCDSDWGGDPNVPRVAIFLKLRMIVVWFVGLPVSRKR